MLLGSIAGLKTGTYTVTRTAANSLLLGRKVAGASSTFPIVAVVQPYAGGRKLLPLPEGVRSEETVHVHTATALRTTDDAGEADSISIGGTVYRVWAVEGPFKLGTSTHYEAYASRKGRP